MCYTGTCPYEGRNGGCKLSDARLDPPPGDAWCSEDGCSDYEPDDPVEPEDENFRRIAEAVRRINELTAEIEGRRAT